MLTKEYRIPMPLSVDEYRVGQLFMIAKHSAEQSRDGEGVEVLENRPHDDPDNGRGQFTEKRIHIHGRLPSWARSFVPRIFYVTEKAWNYYPFTITEYTCSFVPRFSILIKTKYENNAGTTDNCLGLGDEERQLMTVEHLDILLDEIAPHHYKPEEDLSSYQSRKTGRGPLKKGWMDSSDPIMCSYKVVEIKLDIWGIQSKVEDFLHRQIREILLLGHRQAVAWLDDWYGMTIEDVRAYEEDMQKQTNERLRSEQKENVSSANPNFARSASVVDQRWDVDNVSAEDAIDRGVEPSSPATESGAKKGWFSWSW